MQDALFDDEEFFGVDESPLDNTRILMTPLYYSQEEREEYHRLSKAAMKKIWPEKKWPEANCSDLMLHLLRKFHDDNKDNTSEATLF